MVEGVRYQVYATKDERFVLLMASEQAFWKNFCAAVDRMDMFERWPGSKYADHARNNTEMRRELRDIFRAKTAEQWIAFGIDEDVPIAPVNSPQTIAEDPQFRDRFHWIPEERLGAEELSDPAQVRRRGAPRPRARADRRPAHRRGPPRRARLGRRCVSARPAPAAGSAARARVRLLK